MAASEPGKGSQTALRSGRLERLPLCSTGATMHADYQVVARHLEALADGRLTPLADDLRRLAENVRRMGVMVQVLRDLRSRDAAAPPPEHPSPEASASAPTALTRAQGRLSTRRATPARPRSPSRRSGGGVPADQQPQSVLAPAE